MSITEREIDGHEGYPGATNVSLGKSTQAMRDRARELANPPRDDFDRAVLCIVDHLEAALRPCGECHLQPGERCDICGKTASWISRPPSGGAAA